GDPRGSITSGKMKEGRGRRTRLPASLHLSGFRCPRLRRARAPLNGPASIRTGSIQSVLLDHLPPVDQLILPALPDRRGRLAAVERLPRPARPHHLGEPV